MGARGAQMDRSLSGRGVVARIVTGPHDAHRQDPHLPMGYDTGRPSSVIRLRISQPGTDAPICQDTCSGGLGAVLAHGEVCHHALVAFTIKEAFEASNDLARGPAIGGAACGVVDGQRLDDAPVSDDRQVNSQDRRSVKLWVRPSPTGTHRAAERPR